MAITNGSLADADEVLNAMGMVVNNTAQTIFNADYIGFDAELNDNNGPNLKNFEYETGLITLGCLSFGTNLYDFNQEDVDTDVWTIAYTIANGVTSNGYYMSIRGSNGNGTVSAISNGTNPLTIEDGSSTFMNMFGQTYATGAGAFYIYDGTTSVLITSNPARDIYRLNVNKTSKTCLLTTSLTNTVDTGTSLSTLNNAVDWYFKFQGTPSSSIIEISMLSSDTFNVSNPITINFGTVSETVTNLIPIFNYTDEGVNPVTFDVSVDNGVNWETDITNNTIVRPTNTGSQILLRANMESQSTTAYSSLNEVGVQYNLY